MKVQIKGNYKIKRYKNPELIVKILKHLKSKGLNVPVVISYNDSSITFEYIKGKSLDKMTLTPELIDKAAELLAKLNKVNYKGLEPRTKLLDSFNDKVDELQLSSAESESLKKKYAKLRPKRIKFCLGHFDFKPSNIIYNDGVLWLIDFEGLCLGPIGVELSKACYHFGDKFLKAYSKYGDTSHYLENKEFYDLREQVSQAVNVLKRPRNQDELKTIKRKLRNP